MIHNRLCWLGLMVALTAGLFAGCGKSDSQSSNSGSPVTPSSTLNSQPSPALRLHWLGKKQLAADTNATHFMDIWNLPESAQLEAQTLDKLASAPWRFWQTNTPVSNAPTALLRPLLDDLVQEESYLEVRVATNQPPELVLAVRLPADRAALWQTNLPRALHSLFGPSAATNSASPDFRYQLSTLNHQLSLTRSGAWTLLSVAGPQPLQLLTDFQQRLATNSAPYPARATNYWVEADADFGLLGNAFKPAARLSSSLQRITLSLLGDGTNVRTHAEATFATPPALEFGPWNIPTNLISDQLISFTAARLPAPSQFLSLFNFDLPECLAGQQVFVWALASLPMATYTAIPVSPGGACFNRISQWLLTDANTWIASNSVGSFAHPEAGQSVVWQGAPYMSAFVQSLGASSGEYVLGGLLPTPLTNRAPNMELANRMIQRPKLVYYDWEITAPRIESWFYIGQLARVLMGRKQLDQDSASVVWLKAVGGKLVNAGTVGVMPGDHQIAFDRFATLGLTAIELHLLADWLESPNFPLGTHTTLSPQLKLFRRQPMPAPPGPK